MRSLGAILLGAGIFSRAVHSASVSAHFTAIGAILNLCLVHNININIIQVQNSYSYNQAEWQVDMNSTQQIGIDGFGMRYCHGSKVILTDRKKP